MTDLLLSESEKEQIRELTRKANKGDGESQYILSGLFDDGVVDGEPDIHSAIYWMEKAINNNYTKAMIAMANRCILGRGVVKDYDRAVKLYLKAGELGDANGYRELGTAHMSGIMGKANKRLGIKYLKKAANLGDGKALDILGQAYEAGSGVIRSKKKAMECYEAAIKAGHGYSRTRLASLYEKDGNTKEYRSQLSTIDEEGIGMEVGVLAKKYLEGDGVEQNVEKAIELFERDALEWPDSYVEIGQIYQHAKGVKKDKAKAMEYYVKAAEEGSYEGIMLAIDSYENGTLGDIDLEAAFHLYEQLAEAEIDEGYEGLMHCYSEGRGVEVDMDEAKKWRDKLIKARKFKH